MTAASACGKIILLGEHAVVYGRPALAVPLPQVRATVEIEELTDGEPGAVRLEAPDVGLSAWLRDLQPDHPLAKAVLLVREELHVGEHPPLALRVRSSIPVASGLGSGTAVTVAMVRALSAHWQKPLDAARQSELTYEVEKLHHGTPSGIDNTVVAYEQPVHFVRGRPPRLFAIASPLTLVIGDSGHPSNTSVAVGMVRKAWQADGPRYEELFDRIGEIVDRGRSALETGDLEALGALMDLNQARLQELGVSSRELEALVEAARAAGALGAKLSGAGMGGNMIALADAASAEGIEAALRVAGATWTQVAEVGA